MNLYKVTLDYYCYGVYSGYIVIADSAEDAIEMCFWADAEGCGVLPVAELIGTSISNSARIVLSSFNAG